MHVITERRMSGPAVRNLVVFRELCGEDPLSNVILVTTGWGDANKTGELDQALENEVQLRVDKDFWQPMIARGSKVEKFEDTRDSALDIIIKIAGRQPVLLQIQEELVDQNKDLVNTSAGFTVDKELKELEKKYSAKL